MHASSTPRMVDQRPVAAALAAIFLTVGLALGAAIGITIAPTTSVVAPGAGATSIDPADTSAALQQHVLRENAAGVSTVSSQLQQHLLREYFAAPVPGVAENNMSDAVNKVLNGAAVDAGSARDERGPSRDEGLMSGPAISPAYTADDLFRGDHGLARRAAFPDSTSTAPVGHPDYLRAQPR